MIRVAREFARRFYSSKAWQDCREEYAKRRRYLCEDCLRRGIYRPGEIVHHVIEVDPITIEQPEVTLNHDNLRLLCRDCHGEAHKQRNKGRRYLFDENGKVLIDSPPGSEEKRGSQ